MSTIILALVDNKNWHLNKIAMDLITSRIVAAKFLVEWGKSEKRN